VKEFEKELAVLKGRVDSLEAKVGELEATQFSTTTKLKGIATFVLGAGSFSGSNVNTKTVVRSFANNAGGVFVGAGTGANQAGAATGSGDAAKQYSTQWNNLNYGATSFNYDVRLNFDTSFTGKDLLRTTLRAGNFTGGNAALGGAGTLAQLETAFEQSNADNVVGVNRLFYNFPVGKELNVTAGALVRVDDAGMLGLWPSVYGADTVLDFFTYAGAPGAYNLNGLGSGAGLVYSPQAVKGLTISQNYVAGNAGTGGNVGNPNTGGIMTQGGPAVAVSQIGYTGENTPLIGGSYGLAFAYTYSQNVPLPVGTPMALAFSNWNANLFNAGIGTANQYTTGNNYGLSGYWKPEKAGLIPSFSWGFGVGSYNIAGNGGNGAFGGATALNTSGTQVTTASWNLGLQWDDAFIKGNALGMGVGQAPFVTQTGSGAVRSPEWFNVQRGFASGAQDSNYMWEWWYKFQVTDNISITPAIYYINNFDGQWGKLNNSNGKQDATDNLFGGLIKTTFKF